MCHGGVINSYLAAVLGLADAAELLLPELHVDPPGRGGRQRERRSSRSTRHPTSAAPASRSVCSRLVDDARTALARRSRRASSTRRRRRSTPSGRRVGGSTRRASARRTRRDAWDEVPARGFVVRDGALIAWVAAPPSTVPTPVPDRRRPHRLAVPARQAQPRHRARRAGASSASRSTAGCCSTRGSTATSASPGGSCSATARRTWSTCGAGGAGAPTRDPPRPRRQRARARARQAAAHPSGLGQRRRRPGEFAEWLADAADDRPAGVVGAVPVRRQGAAVLGGDVSLLASGRLDNQVSCWAADDALAASPSGADTVSMIVLIDHEEVGSASTTGASGPLLEHVLERLVLAARWRPRTTSSARSRPRRACRPTTPTPSTPTTPSATSPATARSSTRARRSR